MKKQKVNFIFKKNACAGADNIKLKKKNWKDILKNNKVFIIDLIQWKRKQKRKQKNKVNRNTE